MANAGPVEPALIQLLRCKPDSLAVVHQHFYPVSPAIGVLISTERLRRTERRDHPCQYRLGAGEHVHRLGGQPDHIDADH